VSRIAIGLVAALAIALMLSGATVFGIDVWKIVLAVVGFLIFTSGRRSTST
jgi:uncharacterized membrane protein